MVKTTLSAVGVEASGLERTLSKGQKAFNTLIRQIEKRRASLAEWEMFDTEFQRRINHELLPARKAYDDVRRQFVQALDRSHDGKALTKAERRTIVDLINHIGGDILAGGNDPDVEEIFRRYNAPEAAQDAAVLDGLRHDLEATFGVELGDDVDLTSPEDVFERIQAQMDEREAREREHAKAREAFQEQRKASKKKRKASPDAKAAEERARAEEADVHQSLRDVYRKLVSVLHPDRESDPVERERKAALMQRVNGAYASKSLLELLEIQLELEHIDQAALDSISEDRLKRWNATLKEQLRGLDREIADVEGEFRVRAGMHPTQKPTPKGIKRSLSGDISNLRASTRQFEIDLLLFEDPRRLKLWLQQVRWEMEG
jgi:hypothetical protein